TERGGLPLAEMGPVSQRLAHRLVASGLSDGGYNTAATVMGLENVLDAKEGWRRGYDGRTVPHRGRDPQLYFVSVFGDPGAESWGWRVGGPPGAPQHTLGEDGEVSASPLFLGANPATSPLVGPGVLRPLAAEEDLARELLDALAPDQQATALLSPDAPGDILQRNRPAVRAGPPEGLAAVAMLPQQRELLAGLLRQYFGRLPGPLAELEAGRVLGRGLEAGHFGGAGGAGAASLPPASRTPPASRGRGCTSSTTTSRTAPTTSTRCGATPRATSVRGRRPGSAPRPATGRPGRRAGRRRRSSRSRSGPWPWPRPRPRPAPACP